MLIKVQKSDFSHCGNVMETNDNATVAFTCFTVLDLQNDDKLVQNCIYRSTVTFLKK